MLKNSVKIDKMSKVSVQFKKACLRKLRPENSLERGGNIVDDDDDDVDDNDDDVDDDDTIKAIMEFKMSSLEFEMNEF